MSLDVTLHGDEITERCCCGKCDNEHEHTYRETLFYANITHNLGDMAEEAGIYMHLWRPDELGLISAKELIAPLADGLQKMKDSPEHYKKFDSPNGWGLYIHFVPWIEKYLKSCIEHPESIISVSR
jgi:hypothetical protein